MYLAASGHNFETNVHALYPYRSHLCYNASKRIDRLKPCHFDEHIGENWNTTKILFFFHLSSTDPPLIHPSPGSIIWTSRQLMEISNLHIPPPRSKGLETVENHPGGNHLSTTFLRWWVSSTLSKKYPPSKLPTIQTLYLPCVGGDKELPDSRPTPEAQSDKLHQQSPCMAMDRAEEDDKQQPAQLCSPCLERLLGTGHPQNNVCFCSIQSGYCTLFFPLGSASFSQLHWDLQRWVREVLVWLVSMFIFDEFEMCLSPMEFFLIMVRCLDLVFWLCVRWVVGLPWKSFTLERMMVQ